MQTSTSKEHYEGLPLDELQEWFNAFNELAEEMRKNAETAHKGR